MGSAMLAVAISNLLPAFTFILAVLFRLEKLQMKSRASQVKVIGTFIGMGGAAVLTFCKGHKTPALAHSCPPGVPAGWVARAGQPSAGIALGYSKHFVLCHMVHHPCNVGNLALGSLLATANTLCCAIWFIIHGKRSERYPDPYTSTTLLNLIAAVQCTCIAAITERDASAWKLHWDVNLFTALYVRGHLFVSVFTPLPLIIVTLFGSILIEEPLHLGSVLGTGLIIMGLYTVLWGKGKEIEGLGRLPTQKSVAGEGAKAGLDGVHPKPPGGRPEESRKEEKDAVDQFAGGLQSIHGSL
ncbi:WAT1-related protein At1g09380-like [Nymphaea colorata]|nr:WAT1-related protein At1g09380-like [Nymphaea colorata]